MKIANPLYDHAFKYLMSNERLARKVLSVILDTEVLEVELSQQEMVVEDKDRRFTIYRLDFKAVIQHKTGRRETVLIELQKSKLPTNLLRFRSYLGLTYSQKPPVGPDGNGAQLLPIIAIYILGYNVEDITVMAAKVDRKITDLSDKKELKIQSQFIDLLTHPCYILQVRRLPMERRSRIEQFMTLFNQGWVAEENFILDLEEVPEEFRDVAEYLQRPLQEEEERLKLSAEQELEQLFALQEAEKELLHTKIEEERRLKEEANQREAEARQREAEAKQREEEERRLKEEARQREEEAKQREVEAKQREEEATRKLARLLLLTGASIAEVARETRLTEDEIRQLS